MSRWNFEKIAGGLFSLFELGRQPAIPGLAKAAGTCYPSVHEKPSDFSTLLPLRRNASFQLGPSPSGIRAGALFHRFRG
jgi:hypothetical protein